MKVNNFDYIFIGGGCASLSLAMNIKKNCITKYSFLIIEANKKYEDDKSWCFWSKKDNYLRDLIEKAWDQWSFSLNNNEVTHKNAEYKYFYVRSISFYKNAVKQINNTKNIDILFGQTVNCIKKKRNVYEVVTNKSKYIAKFILDTRPQKNAFKTNPFLYQSFLGYEILLDKKHDFNKKLYLMKDMCSIRNSFFFNYILGLSKYSLLFEITSFSKKKHSKDYLSYKLEDTLKKYGINKYKIIRTEYGIIPMGFMKKRNSSNQGYVIAGASSGALRPSSGYAFLRIQDWAKECAFSIKRKGTLLPHPKQKRTQYILDYLFLYILQNNLKLAPYIFFTFFKRICPASFVRFMTDKNNILDIFKIIFAMPKRIFLLCLIKKS